MPRGLKDLERIIDAIDSQSPVSALVLGNDEGDSISYDHSL